MSTIVINIEAILHDPFFSIVIPLSGVNLSAREMRLLETSFQEHGRITLPAWTLWQE